MESIMRAKMQVKSVESTEYGETLRMNPVCGNNPFPADGVDEDNTYSKFTPSGSLELFVSNPALAGRIKPGQKLYLDFTLAE
jgi:hypothetical protein